MIKKIIVNKFGGGIMTAGNLNLIEKRLREQIKSGFEPVVVVSALSGITDELLALANGKKFNASDLLKKHSDLAKETGINEKWLAEARKQWKKILQQLEKDLSAILRSGPTNASADRIAAYGEKLASIFLSYFLNSRGVKAKEVFAEEIPIITDNNFKNAHIKYEISEKNARKKLIGLTAMPVVAGFTGKTSNGKTTTLGRGGTDTTACFLAAALRAVKVILWKDVGAVSAADPKIVKGAKTIARISYQEAEESGKVIHEKAIQYVKMFKTPTEIASLHNPKQKTEISLNKIEKNGAKIISFRKNLSLFIITEETIRMTELLNLACRTFLKYKMEIILISNARYILQIVADNSNGQAQKVYHELKNKVTEIKVRAVNMIYLVGGFKVKDVNDFNDILIKQKTGMEISAFLYENCARIEAIVRSDKIENIVRVLYKKFIK